MDSETAGAAHQWRGDDDQYPEPLQCQSNLEQFSLQAWGLARLEEKLETNNSCRSPHLATLSGFMLAATCRGRFVPRAGAAISQDVSTVTSPLYVQSFGASALDPCGLRPATAEESELETFPTQAASRLHSTLLVDPSEVVAHSVPEHAFGLFGRAKAPRRYRFAGSLGKVRCAGLAFKFGGAMIDRLLIVGAALKRSQPRLGRVAGMGTIVLTRIVILLIALCAIPVSAWSQSNSNHQEPQLTERCIETASSLNNGFWARGGKRVGRDAESVVEACERARVIAPENQTVLAALALGYLEVGRHDEARVIVVSLANLSNPQGCYLLGFMHEQGVGRREEPDKPTRRDMKEATRWYRKAAEQGYAEAQYRIGFNKVEEVRFQKAMERRSGQYRRTESPESIDEREALEWLLKAAAQGHLSAQIVTAEIYLHGLGSIRKNTEEAAKWYLKAAEQDDVGAQYNLGIILIKGEGLDKDLVTARYWLAQSAEKGFAASQYALAALYYSGNGVDKDLSAAVNWFSKAADQGDSRAQFMMGDLYSKGEGVARSDEEALEWYLKAAVRGYRPANLTLSDRYGRGLGVERDLSRAADLAFEGGDQRSAFSYLIEKASHGRELGQFIASLDERDKIFALAALGLPDQTVIAAHKSNELQIGRFDDQVRIHLGFYSTLPDVLLSKFEDGGSREAPLLRVLHRLNGQFGRELSKWELEKLELAQTRGSTVAGAFLAMWRPNAEFELPDLESGCDQFSVYLRTWLIANRKGLVGEAFEGLEWHEGCDDRGLAALQRLGAQLLERLGQSHERVWDLYRRADDGGDPIAKEWIANWNRQATRAQRASLNAWLRESVDQNLKYVNAAVAGGDIRRALGAIAEAMGGVTGLQDRNLSRHVIVTYAVIAELSVKKERGLIDGYFSLSETSCHLGKASQAAYRSGEKDLALALAKRAVNKLQDARRLLDDLPKELRECFLKEHEDRYRWLASLFIEQGRENEALEVDRMLRDSQYAEYIRENGMARELVLLKIPMTRAELELAERLDGGVATIAKSAERQSELSARRANLSPAEQQELDSLDDLGQAWNVAISGILRVLEANWKPNCDTLTPGDCALKPRDVSGPINNVQVQLRASHERTGKAAAVLFSFVLPQKTMFLLVTKEDEITPLVWHITPAELGDKIKRLRQTIGRREDAQELAKELYREIILPLKSRLAGIETLYLSLDRVLSNLPMAALYDGELGQYLVEQFSLAIWAEGGHWGKWEPDPLVAAFGVSKGMKDVEPFPGVEEELKGIVRKSGERSGLFGGERWLNEEFTRTSIQKAVRGRYRVWHFATHFTIGGSDWLSANLLIGEDRNPLVPVKDLADLLAPPSVRGPDLLVLSACETAIPIEAIEGTPWRASAQTLLKSSRARAVLGTLWRVRDASTAPFMLRLYDVLNNEPTLSLEEALAATQRTFIRKKVVKRDDNSLSDSDMSRPIHWAGFILFKNLE